MSRNGSPWTPEELATLRRTWLDSHAAGDTTRDTVIRCAKLLPGRTRAAIRTRAYEQGLPVRPATPNRGNRTLWKPRYAREAT